MKKIPLTLPQDLANNPNLFFTVPEEMFIKVFTTSGTTGKPKKAYFTKKDIDKILESTAIGAELMYGISRKDVIRITFEEGYGTEIWGNRYSIDQAYGGIIGALTITTGRLPVEYELAIIREYKPNVFADVSSRVNYLTNELKKMCDLKELGIKKFLIGAEPTPNTMRKNIENAWNADVFIGYGTTELGLLMAGECKMKHGMHLSETNFFTEVIDPKTGEHNSHDLGIIIPDICECGLPLKKIEIKGRTDDLIPIGAGDNIFTKIFDDAIFSISEVIEYQVIFDKKNGQDLITVVAESEIINDKIKKKIMDTIMKIPEIKNGIDFSKTITEPIIQIVKPNTFDRDSIKFKRLIDKRNLYN